MKSTDFCMRLKLLRKISGLTQLELETKANMAETLISQYESGNREPSLQNIICLCKGLDCTATQLLGI